MRSLDPPERTRFENRKRDFLRYVAEHKDNPLTTAWGAYRSFDGYGLALLALGDDEAARRLLNESLDMIDRNVADERAHPANKWHLADFAMHPLLRAYLKYRPTHFPADPVWTRIEKTAVGFPYHRGDLSENHNLLHLVLRYLVGQTWPDATFADGRTGRAHRDEARGGIGYWMRTFVTRGSGEWGSDIYYNVDVLALLNLRDFADDPKFQRRAQAMLDLFALDEALDAFAGSSVGAAKRDYAVYRMDGRQSPSRPLHYLWFDPPDPQAGTPREPFNLNFIGGVIEAATSDYLPPAPVRWIANETEPAASGATYLVGWDGSAKQPLSKHTLRLSDVMQSTMNSPGGGARYTEQVWQLTMGEQAVVFANHPTLSTAKDSEKRDSQINEALELYAQPRPRESATTQPWYWTYANVPPGHSGDVRPGYWQGNGAGPRSFATGPLAFLVFNIPDDNPLPWAHLYLPRGAFDEVREEKEWIFIRHGTGYAALWLPTGYVSTTEGFWADSEVKVNGSRCGVLSLIGDANADADFSHFIGRAKALQPVWDSGTLALSARSSDGGDDRITVSYDGGPSRAGKDIETAGPRIQTPWGTMPMGSPALRLRTPAGTCDIAVEDLR